MRRILITGYLLLAALLAPVAYADEIQLNEDVPEIYVVKEGDTVTLTINGNTYAGVVASGVFSWTSTLILSSRVRSCISC